MDFPKLKTGSPVESSRAEKDEDQEEEDERGEAFGVILSRSRSLPFATSILALRAEKEVTSSLENAVKRAFFLRRLSSVSSSTRYYKVFHHCRLPEQADAAATAHTNKMNVARK